MNAGEIMSADVFTVKRESTIEEIARIMTEKNVGGVPVVDEENRVLGIVTQKDLLYKDIEPRFPPVVEILGSMIFLTGVKHYQEELRKMVATKAEDIMTKRVVTVEEDTDIRKVAELMVEMDINRVPVVKEGRLIGIIAREDIIRHIAGQSE